jgi:hypothetical protein
MKDELISLISSMTASEKRYFRGYQRGTSDLSSAGYIKLFDFYESGKTNDDLFVRKAPDMTKMKLANLKRHLYKVLLRSLRSQYTLSKTEILISENVDYARILYAKGLYRQSLKILDKALRMAVEHEELVLQLEIMEFEKMIESRHITRSRRVENKVEHLIDRSHDMSIKLALAVDLSNLSLEIHGFYIKNGLARSPTQKLVVAQLFLEQLQSFSEAELETTEFIYLQQSMMWYYYLLSDVSKVYRYSRQWMQAYLDAPALLQKDPDPFLRSLHYVVNACFYARDHKRVKKYVQYFNWFEKQDNLLNSTTTEMLFFIYSTNARLNLNLIEGRYRKALTLTPSIHQGIENFSRHIDTHRVIILYYKLAWINYGIGSYSTAVDYINRISQFKTDFLRTDVLCYVKLLQLCIHLSWENYQLCRSLIRATERQFKKSKLSSPLVDITLQTIKNYLNAPLNERNQLKDLNARYTRDSLIEEHQEQTIYFNFKYWIQAECSGTTIEKVARRDYLDRQNTH